MEYYPNLPYLHFLRLVLKSTVVAVSSVLGDDRAAGTHDASVTKQGSQLCKGGFVDVAS